MKKKTYESDLKKYYLCHICCCLIEFCSNLMEEIFHDYYAIYMQVRKDTYSSICMYIHI